MHFGSAAFALEEWHDFYVLLGTAAAALVALLFVAVSVGIGFLNEQRSGATRTFLSPVVIHFSSVLFISAIALTPARAPRVIEMFISLNAIVGAVVSTVIFARVARSDAAGVVLFDRFAYGAIPAIAYVITLVAMILATRGFEWSLHLLAGGLLTLLLINIRNAWDMMVSLVFRQGGARNGG